MAESDFKTVLKSEISNNGGFRKYLSLLATNDDVLKFYVDIRTYFIDGQCEQPTRYGVFLTMDEFKNILPYLSTKKSHEIDGNRKISFAKNGWLSDLKLTKVDGKESNISLNINEIEKITSFKDEIFKFVI